MKRKLKRRARLLWVGNPDGSSSTEYRPFTNTNGGKLFEDCFDHAVPLLASVGSMPVQYLQHAYGTATTAGTTRLLGGSEAEVCSYCFRDSEQANKA